MNDVNPDLPTPSPELLAVSAVLDGTATPAEQALVDASPRLQAELAGLRAHRAAIADVGDIPVTAEVREWSIRAALGVYDEMVAGAGLAAAAGAGASAVAADATVIRFERRRRAYRAVMGAAAAVVVLFVGFVVVGGRGGDDATSSRSADPMAATAKSADTGAEQPVSASAPGGIAESDAAAQTDAAAEGAATMSADTTPVAGGADTTTPAPAYTIGTGGASVGTALESPEQVRAYAAGREAAVPAPGERFPCITEGAEALGAVTYRGVPSVVARDPATGVVTVFALDTCSELVRVTP